jgi:hypothetical protein
MTFKIVRYLDKNGMIHTRLISEDELEDEPIENFFIPNLETEIEVRGEVEMSGGTDELDYVYTSD